MNSLWQHIKTGDWLTAGRARAYSLILLAVTSAAIVGWIALSHGLIDPNGKPLGTDFSDPYAAGTLALAGHAADAYVPTLQHRAEMMVFGNREVPFYGWHYPPFFFAVAVIVAVLPYAWGLLLWLGASFAGYLVVLRAILPLKETLLLALAFPAVFINIGHGQNGFLTATLLGGALLVMDRRPLLSGVLIGLLAYKPQFGVMIPLALIVGARWSTIAAAIATVMALIALATAALGIGIWHAFFDSMTFTRNVVLEQGGTGWEKIQSIFSAVSAWGASVHTAYACQAALAATLAISIAWLWRSNAAFDLKASALATASLLATPYVLDYDLVVLAVSIALLARHGVAHGFRHYEITMLGAAWAVPLFSRSIASVTGIPLGLVVMLALYVVTIRRAVIDLRQMEHSPDQSCAVTAV
ncbi:MAG: DUF2029 domain-containing protein [Xanthobacteraceae bacterium]|nr:DUF2029 domain-containing protein [Xanthobacteraceae bacterium]